MSGYLEVKYPFKSNLGLNPFKSWKRQWCILRPSPTFSGGILAVYCSEAGASAGNVELPSGFVVRRTKSRSRPHAFAVFPPEEPRKPRVFLAANNAHEAHVWMEKIKTLITANNVLDTPLLKDSFSVSINATELSRRFGLHADGRVTVTPSGLLVANTQKPPVIIDWKYISGVTLSTDNHNPTCVITVNSEFGGGGGGSLQLRSPLAGEVQRAARDALHLRTRSRSDSDLLHDEGRHSSMYSGPSEESLEDLDLITSKERGSVRVTRTLSATSLDNSISDRRSVASGIYEEIPDLPDHQAEDVYCKMTRDPTRIMKLCEEPMYERVGAGRAALYATVRRRRHPPPPLPPRALAATPPAAAPPAAAPSAAIAPHDALGAAPAAGTLPRASASRHAFTAFRKRLKSDSRVAVSPKADPPKEKDVETKKKKFDFPPTRDIFKSFKVSRKMKNLKIASSNLAKGETRSCEFLDEVSHGAAARCAKSVECLEAAEEFLDRFDDGPPFRLPAPSAESAPALALPHQIVELIIKENILLKGEDAEGDYVPMSPIVPQPPAPIEHHYIVMSPRTNTA